MLFSYLNGCLNMHLNLNILQHGICDIRNRPVFFPHKNLRMEFFLHISPHEHFSNLNKRPQIFQSCAISNEMSCLAVYPGIELHCTFHELGKKVTGRNLIITGRVDIKGNPHHKAPRLVFAESSAFRITTGKMGTQRGKRDLLTGTDNCMFNIKQDWDLTSQEDCPEYVLSNISLTYKLDFLSWTMQIIFPKKWVWLVPY